MGRTETCGNDCAMQAVVSARDLVAVKSNLAAPTVIATYKIERPPQDRIASEIARRPPGT